MANIAALRPRNRNAGHGGETGAVFRCGESDISDGAEVLRYRIEDLESGMC